MRFQFLRVNPVCTFKHLGNKKGGINAPLALRLATTVTFSLSLLATLVNFTLLVPLLVTVFGGTV
jgi:hypothetical protein